MVYVVIRNEPERRCVVGVGKTKAAAQRIVREDTEKHKDRWASYDIVPLPLEDDIVPLPLEDETNISVGKDYWGCWTVDCGYYVGSNGLCWVIERIEPNSEEAAWELAALGSAITAMMPGRKQATLPGIVAAVFQQPKNAYRLRAKKTPHGWRISEYDFDKWSFLVP